MHPFGSAFIIITITTCTSYYKTNVSTAYPPTSHFITIVLLVSIISIGVSCTFALDALQCSDMLNKSLKALHYSVYLAKGGRAYVGVPSRCDVHVNFSFNINLYIQIFSDPR